MLFLFRYRPCLGHDRVLQRAILELLSFISGERSVAWPLEQINVICATAELSENGPNACKMILYATIRSVLHESAFALRRCSKRSANLLCSYSSLLPLCR